MQVKCPECGTPFKVRDELLEPDGKKLKCTKCAHRWHQDPPSKLAAATPAPAPAPEPEPAPAPPPPAPEPAPAPAPVDDVPLSADPGDAPATEEPAFDGGDVPMSADPNDDQTLADIIGMDDAGDSDVAMSADPEGYEAPSDDDLGAATNDLNLDIDDSDLNDLFGGSGSSKDEHVDVDHLLNDDDPEPIPEMFTASPFKGKAKKKGSKLPLILLMLVVLLGGTLGGAWFFRSMIEEQVPALKPFTAYFDMLPFGETEKWAGLKILKGPENIKTEYADNALIIRGSIVNANSGERPIPNIKLSIFDATEQSIQETIAEPPQATISGGGKVRFIVRLENPSENAKSFNVDFTDEPTSDSMGAGQ